MSRSDPMSAARNPADRRTGYARPSPPAVALSRPNTVTRKLSHRLWIATRFSTSLRRRAAWVGKRVRLSGRILRVGTDRIPHHRARGSRSAGPLRIQPRSVDAFSHGLRLETGLENRNCVPSTAAQPWSECQPKARTEAWAPFLARSPARSMLDRRAHPAAPHPASAGHPTERRWSRDLGVTTAGRCATTMTESTRPGASVFAAIPANLGHCFVPLAAGALGNSPEAL